MKIGVMTTWGTSCGIATYSEELFTELAMLGVPVTVLAPSEPGSMLVKRSDLPVEMCWARDVHGIADSVLAAVKRYGLNLVHIQHEFGLFQQPEAFYDLLVRLRRAEVALVVTLHTVFPYPAQWAGFFADVRRAANTVVVHTRQAQASLLATPGSAPVKCIPHGSPWPQTPGDKTTGQDFLRIPRHQRDDEWTHILAFGFVGPSKNLDATLDAYSQLRTTYRKVGLIICGEGDGGYYSDEMLPMRIKTSGYSRDVVRCTRFVKPNEVADVVAAADFGVLNERNLHVLSASGQVHLLAAHGLPLAVADVPKHTEALQAGAVPFQIDVSAPERGTRSLVNAMCALSKSRALRESVARGLRGMAERTAWSRIAKAYEATYKKILGA